MKVAGVFLAAISAGMAFSSPGSTCLEQPENFTAYVVNTNITLKWDWNNPCGLNVTFSVQFGKSVGELESWSIISECQNVKIMECDVSAAISNFYEYYNVSVRAYAGDNYSPWASLEFNPDQEAKVGPPGVHLESIHGGDWKIIISNPDLEFWSPAKLDYKLTIWKNSSYPEKKTLDVFSGQAIPDLEPEKTYCLTVKGREENSIPSPEICIKTLKAWSGLPRPENLHIYALNMKYILYWNNTYDGNVSFTVQLLLGYHTKMSPDISKNWLSVAGCENIQTMHCDFSSAVAFHGIYYFRVQAVHNNNKSPWSKMLKFEPKDDNVLGAPSVTVNASEDSLNIDIAFPGESEKNDMNKVYGLTYRVHYWMESSSYSKKIKEGTTSISISGLVADTSYCLKVQAYSLEYQKSSKFSNVTCTKTIKGKPSHFKNGVAFLIALAVCVVTACLIVATYKFSQQLKHVFFPSCHLPKFLQIATFSGFLCMPLLFSPHTPSKQSKNLQRLPGKQAL
uniref:Interferon alpha and beta receptor subunit 1 n=1 Tax=Salvator merianae TaxID=96440 RepID=A0A8D0ECD4_SALMN